MGGSHCLWGWGAQETSRSWDSPSPTPPSSRGQSECQELQSPRLNQSPHPPNAKQWLEGPPDWFCRGCGWHGRRHPHCKRFMGGQEMRMLVSFPQQRGKGAPLGVLSCSFTRSQSWREEALCALGTGSQKGRGHRNGIPCFRYQEV